MTATDEDQAHLDEFYEGNQDNLDEFWRGFAIFEDWRWRHLNDERRAALDSYADPYEEPDPGRAPLDISGWNVREDILGGAYVELDPRVLPGDEETRLERDACERFGRGEFELRLSGYRARGFLEGIHSIGGPSVERDSIDTLRNSVMDILEELRALRAEVAELRGQRG